MHTTKHVTRAPGSKITRATNNPRLSEADRRQIAEARTVLRAVSQTVYDSERPADIVWDLGVVADAARALLRVLDKTGAGR